MGISHFAVYFGFGDHCGNRVDYHDIDCAGTHQSLADFKRLLAGIGLRDEQRVDVHAERLCIYRIQCVLNVDKNRFAAALLGLGDDVQRNGGFTGGFRPEDLNDSALGNTADSQSMVEQQRAGRNCLDVERAVLPELHHRTLAELAFDLKQCCFQCLLFFIGHVKILHLFCLR